MNTSGTRHAAARIEFRAALVLIGGTCAVVLAASPSNRIDDVVGPPAPAAAPKNALIAQGGAGNEATAAQRLRHAVTEKGAGNVAAAEPGWCTYPKPKDKPALGAVAGLIVVPESEGNGTPATADLIPHGTGPGESRNINITGQISPNDDTDFFRFSAQKGEIIGLAALGGGAVDTLLFVTDLTADPIIINDDHQGIAGIYPVGAPFPGGAFEFDSALTWVVPQTGDYLIALQSFNFLSSGAYTIQLRSSRPAFEAQSAPATQIIFLDFNSAIINAQAIFGIGNINASLSPLSAFLAGWGLGPADENAVIDAIVAVFEENFNDLRLAALNGDRDVDGIDGNFDIEVRNSRDHADPFGSPNASRVIIGGSISQLGIGTIGIAETIDPGNFGGTDTAVVLLDLLSGPANDLNSINSIPRAAGTSIIDAIGLAVGNIAAHEAGHFLGNWHTENQNGIRCIMDQGGFLAQNVAGVGPDGTLGTVDDIDPDFVNDAYDADEFIAIGGQRTDVRTAHALSTGTVGGQGCDVTCDIAAIPENEADCGLPTDTTNGGCNSNPPVFLPIQCGDVVCGTAATDLGLGMRDTDWYELVLDQEATVSWTVTAEFSALIGILDNGGVDQCPAESFLDAAEGVACETIVVEEALPAGTWWFFVAPDGSESVECGAEYEAILECTDCDPTPNDTIFVSALLSVNTKTDSIAGNHDFGTEEVFDSINFPGQGFTVAVSSGPSLLPDFDWHTTMDFTGFDPDFFLGGNAFYDISNINPIGTLAPISNVTVKNAFGDPLAGSGSFNATSLEFTSTVNDLVNGGRVAVFHWAQACPEPCTILSSAPDNCAVDARQPHDLNEANAREGWDRILMQFDCPNEGAIPTSLDDFMITSDTPPTPSIALINANSADEVEVIFNQPIPPGGWTCLTHVDSGEQVCIGSLPGDVNLDGTSAPADILGVIDCLNGVAGFRCELVNTDIDRSGEAGPPDILRVIDLLNGASAFDVWLDATISTCPN